jgi:sulfonate transport system substrate-binding protein
VAARRAQPRCLHRPGGHHRQLAKSILRDDLAQENLAAYFDPRLDAGFVGLLQQGVDLAAKERLIRRDFQVSEWVEPRFLDAALQQDQAVQAAR